MSPRLSKNLSLRILSRVVASASGYANRTRLQTSSAKVCSISPDFLFQVRSSALNDSVWFLRANLCSSAFLRSLYPFSVAGFVPARSLLATPCRLIPKNAPACCADQPLTTSHNEKWARYLSKSALPSYLAGITTGFAIFSGFIHSLGPSSFPPVHRGR